MVRGGLPWSHGSFKPTKVQISFFSCSTRMFAGYEFRSLTSFTTLLYTFLVSSDELLRGNRYDPSNSQFYLLLSLFNMSWCLLWSSGMSLFIFRFTLQTINVSSFMEGCFMVKVSSMQYHLFAPFVVESVTFTCSSHYTVQP